MPTYLKIRQKNKFLLAKFKYCFLLFFVLANVTFAQQFQHPKKLPVKERYKNEYESAEAFCKSISQKTDTIARVYRLESKKILPIVFPECMRYNVILDNIETFSLELLYEKYGKEYSDFSIGRFQMKPSFIEQLEQAVQKDSLHLKEFKLICQYSNKNIDKLIRMERISRLKSLEWQIVYLCCFYKIMETRFSTLQFQSPADKICFYATAYNIGFWKSKTELEKWKYINIFPSGKIDNFNNYPYGRISQEYYINNIRH